MLDGSKSNTEYSNYSSTLIGAPFLLVLLFNLMSALTEEIKITAIIAPIYKFQTSGHKDFIQRLPIKSLNQGVMNCIGEKFLHDGTGHDLVRFSHAGSGRFR